MTNYESGYNAGLTGELPPHHEGLMYDEDYSEGFDDGRHDREVVTKSVDLPRRVGTTEPRQRKDGGLMTKCSADNTKGGASK